ncbi:MAG: serine hydrolase [Rhizomicrobium sp.]|jgi:CubicO group peptidase (beta-lactamase class C family)
MVQMVSREAFCTGRALPILAPLASALLLSSCAGFDPFHWNDAPAPQVVTLPQQQVAQVPPPKQEFWPTHGWRYSSPEAQGLDSTVLANALETIKARHIPVNSVLIERHGDIVLDVYFHPYAEDEPHDVASVTKSVTSTLVGIAMAEHKLDRLDVPVAQLLPDAKLDGDPRKERITLAHLLSMTSGLDCSNEGGRNFLQQMEASRHWVSFAMARPETSDPGSTFAYCAGNMHLVSAVLTRATGESASDFARSHLFQPLGIEQVSWPKDADGISHGFADMKIAPRDMAKLGYLWLHHGQWDGKQIVPANYLADAFTPHANVEPDVRYGYGMWIYPERGHAGGPADIEANGNGGQRIAVIPSQDIVEVITGSGLDANQVAELLTDAVKSDAALPQNSIAQSRLAMRIAEAESGAAVQIAQIAPKPRPATDVAAEKIGSPIVVAAIVPKPRPEFASTAALSLAGRQFAVMLPKLRPHD